MTLPQARTDVAVGAGMIDGIEPNRNIQGNTTCPHSLPFNLTLEYSNDLLYVLVLVFSPLEIAEHDDFANADIRLKTAHSLRYHWRYSANSYLHQDKDIHRPYYRRKH